MQGIEGGHACNRSTAPLRSSPVTSRPAEDPEGHVRQGTNSWQRVGYGGPCPPSGTHRYYFRVYALDRELDLDTETTKAALVATMEGHVLARGELMGTYARG